MRAGNAPAYPLVHAYLYLSGGCNLRCAHCWISPDFAPGREAAFDRLTTADVKKIVDEGRPLGLSHVKLTGGEPFLNKDIFDIIDLLAGRSLSVSIETNGTLIDRDAAAFLGKKGVGSVSVSMDSHRASFHDAFRGVEGAFDGVVAGDRASRRRRYRRPGRHEPGHGQRRRYRGAHRRRRAARGAFGEDQSRQSRRKGRRPDGSGEDRAG